MVSQKNKQNKKQEETVLVGSVNLMIYDIDINGTFITINSNCKNIAGYAIKEMLGHQIWEFIVPNTVNQYKKYYKKNIENKITYLDCRHDFIHKNGKILRLESSGIPIVENGKCIGYKNISKDVTKEEQMEKTLKIKEHELLQRNQELEHFTFSVSHDLKAPLVTLEGFSSIMQEDIGFINDSCPFNIKGKCEKKGKLKQLYRSSSEIRKAVQGLSSNIESLLELSKIGRLHVNRTRISPKKIIKYVISINKEYVTKSKAIININCTVPKMNIQKEIFTSIIQNIMTNAWLHSKRKNTEELKIDINIQKKDGKDVLISIENNGKGMSKNKIKNMFNEQTTRYQGFGLSIIKTGIEWHNGKIWAEGIKNGGIKINMIFPDCI